MWPRCVKLSVRLFKHLVLLLTCTGLRNLLHPCIRDARKWRENEEMKRKRRENEDMERKWRENEEKERDSLCYISSFSLYFLPLYSFPIFCQILSQNIKYGTFVANFTTTKNLAYALWGNNSGSISLRKLVKPVKRITATSNARFWVWVHLLVNLVAMAFLFTMNLYLPWVLNFNLSQARLLKETACNYVFFCFGAWNSSH